MRFFSQRRRKGHLKANSDHVRGPPSQSTDSEFRPSTAPVDTYFFEPDQPPARPPRPRRSEATYSFPPPPPLWDRPEDFDRWIQSHHMATQSQPAAVPQQPAYQEAVPVDESSIRDVVSDRLSEIISMIDEDAYLGSNPEVLISLPSPVISPQDSASTPATIDSEKTLVNFTAPQSRFQSKTATYQLPNRSERTINFLAKVSYYSNSRLPPSLPPLRVYIPTWPLFCLAAQYSSTAYLSPSSSDWSDRASCYIPSNPSTGTKAMIIKSVPCDTMKTIVFAIRGTSVLSLRDWNTNLNTKPTSPAGFLDDAGNLCHAGFLRVAKAMIQPIANRIRQLLYQNPSRSQCSLLITGHSAGGAVASLIYTHMLSQMVTSDLTRLTSCFKRVHCVTFGAPPVSLIPLSKPPGSEERLRKCLFHSFINEGDPVVRAEKSYIRSLVDLVTTQVPNTQKVDGMRAMGMVTASLGKLDLGLIPAMAMESKDRLKKIANRPAAINRPANRPITAEHLQSLDHLIPVPFSDEKEVVVQKGSDSLVWTLPPSTLTNAGRLVVLRVAPRSYSHRQGSPEINSPGLSTSDNLKHEFETVHAETLGENQLRNVVFGDPLMHGMDVYRRRVEALAMKAVTGRVGEP